jgi:hypothetical protein
MDKENGSKNYDKEEYNLNKESNKTPEPLILAPVSNIKFAGSRAIIPTMIISEIPFPIPLSVIFSPSHITNIVPAVSIITDEIVKKVPPRINASGGRVLVRLTMYVGA